AWLELTTGMTLEAWVNPATVSSAWRDVVYKGNDNYYLSATSTNATNPVGGLIINGNHAEAIGSAGLPLNTWTYRPVTYDGTAVSLYVNGLMVSSTPSTGPMVTSNNPLQIGGDSFFGQYFAGLIDEVRVYNGALTAARIQTDMITPIGALPPDTQ